MKRFAALALSALFTACPLLAQVTPYGSPTPAGFGGTFDSGGQLPYVGNANFKLVLETPNLYGGGVILGFNPAFIAVNSSILFVDTNGAVIVALPAGVTEMPLAVPAVPGIAGYTGYAQAGVFDAALPGGLGLTNAISVTVLPDRTPTRAYIPGQDFSFGASAPGQMCVMDLSVQPPVFRATGSVGFSGNLTVNFPNKIAVADVAQIAYALGNTATTGPTNQFVRAFSIAADPAGVVTHVPIGDIPVAGEVTSSVGARDMEAMANGQYLFVTSGSSNVSLEVFDVSNMPSVVPTSAIQTIAFNGAGSGAVGLELSPAEDRLAVLISSDSFSTITLYHIIIGAPQPLSPYAYLTLGAFTGSSNPSEAHFSPDGRLLFVTGSNGYFNVIDTTPSPPAILVGLGIWSAVSFNNVSHGSAVAVQNGAPVGIVGGEGSNALYYLIDLNTTSPTFGTVTGSFTTNPTGNGNISNHRMHGRQNIVVAIDGTGATVDCDLVDVIDLNQTIPGGYQSWRVKMPSYSTLTPAGISCIPRDFDMF